MQQNVVGWAGVAASTGAPPSGAQDPPDGVAVASHETSPVATLHPWGTPNPTVPPAQLTDVYPTTLPLHPIPVGSPQVHGEQPR